MADVDNDQDVESKQKSAPKKTGKASKDPPKAKSPKKRKVQSDDEDANESPKKVRIFKKLTLSRSDKIELNRKT